MFYYQIYGLKIKSSININFLTTEVRNDHVDLCIECVESIDFTSDKSLSLGLAIDAQNNLLLDIPNIAKYKITNDKILVYKSVDIDLDSVVNFLVSSAIPYYLAKKGKVILRGCAYTKNHESANLILGCSGVGKSTLLAAFCQKDYKMLSDQFCVLTQINDKIYVEPAFPKIKLWLQATRVLKIDETDVVNLPRVRPDLKRYYHDAPFYSTRLEVKNIFKIKEQNLERDALSEEVVGVKKINILKHDIVGKEFDFLEKSRKGAVAKTILTLASQVAFFKIFNIRGKSIINDLCQLIANKCNEEK